MPQTESPEVVLAHRTPSMVASARAGGTDVLMAALFVLAYVVTLIEPVHTHSMWLLRTLLVVLP